MDSHNSGLPLAAPMPDNPAPRLEPDDNPYRAEEAEGQPRTQFLRQVASRTLIAIGVLFAIGAVAGVVIPVIAPDALVDPGKHHNPWELAFLVVGAIAAFVYGLRLRRGLTRPAPHS